SRPCVGSYRRRPATRDDRRERCAPPGFLLLATFPRRACASTDVNATSRAASHAVCVMASLSNVRSSDAEAFRIDFGPPGFPDRQDRLLGELWQKGIGRRERYRQGTAGGVHGARR